MEGPGGGGGEACFPYPAAEQILDGGGVSRCAGVGVLEEVGCWAESVLGGEGVARPCSDRLRVPYALGLRTPSPAASTTLPAPAPGPAAPPPRPVVPARSLRAAPAPRWAAQLRAGALLPGNRGVLFPGDRRVRRQ